MRRSAAVTILRGLFGTGALVWLQLACAISAAALEFPKLSGRVVDDAGIIGADTARALDQKLAKFETDTSGQFVVVTLKSLQGTSIEDYGYQLGRAWGIGQRDKNSGVLLIVAPNERKVRIEVGYGLEGQLTDAVSSLIVQNSILPRFRANDFPGGIVRGVDDVIQALNDPEEWRSRTMTSRPPGDPEVALILIIFIFVLVIFFFVRAVTSGSHVRRGRDDTWPWGGTWSSGSSSSSSGWSSGSSGGFSGGGFSGGGGSFGGGGASGSW